MASVIDTQRDEADAFHSSRVSKDGIKHDDVSMKEKNLYPFPNSIPLYIMLFLSFFSFIQIIVMSLTRCAISSFTALETFQFISTFFFVMSRSISHSFFYRSTILFHSIYISFSIAWMVGTGFLCTNQLIAVLFALHVILVVLLFLYDSYLYVRISQYFHHISIHRREFSKSASDNDSIEKRSESLNTSNFVGALTSSGVTKSMSMSTFDKSSASALSPVRYNKMSSSGGKPSLGVLALPSFITGSSEYRFNRAEATEDVEMGGQVTPSSAVEKVFSTPPRKGSDGMEGGGRGGERRRMQRSRRTIVLDGFRVNLKLSVLKTQEPEETKELRSQQGFGSNHFLSPLDGRPIRRKFRTDLSMSMFAHLGPQSPSSPLSSSSDCPSTTSIFLLLLPPPLIAPPQSPSSSSSLLLL